jgi:hypothetical protein
MASRLPKLIAFDLECVQHLISRFFFLIFLRFFIFYNAQLHTLGSVDRHSYLSYVPAYFFFAITR